jgi:hypothetical protein
MDVFALVNDAGDATWLTAGINISENAVNCGA